MALNKLSTLLFCACLLPLGGCVVSDFGNMERNRADFNYTFDLTPNGRVSLESLNGSIEVEGWDQNKVEITGSKYASTKEMLDLLRIETHNAPDRVEVRAIRPSASHGNVGAKFMVKVPKTATVDRLVSSNGHIAVTDVAAAPRVKTSNAAIDITSVRGPVILHTSNGHIHVEHAEAEVEAETSNGGIKIISDGNASIKASTSNSSVELDLSKAPKHDIRAHSSNGSITLHLPETSTGRIKADTSNNPVHCDFEITTSGTQSKSHLNGTIGSGGPNIELSTSNGSIRIVKGL